MDQSAKVALVTGGGTGIGRSTTLKLAERGVKVAINYSRSQSDAEQTLDDVSTLGGEGMLAKANVAVDGEVRAMIDSVVDRFGRLDILVNNAGATTFISLDNLEGLGDEHWEQALSVNVKGTFYCCRAAAGALRAHSGSSIVNIASVAGIIGRGSSIAYCASKAGVIAVTKSLAQVLSPQVRVNAVAPGVVVTRWGKGYFEDPQNSEPFIRATPLERIAGPDDPADVAVALALDFELVTGETIVVDGGLNAFGHHVPM